MNCLSNNKIQEYIDNELDASELSLVSNHINSCEECKKLHFELLADISFVNDALSVFKTEPKNIPSIEKYSDIKKVSVFRMPIFLKVSAAVLFIAISISIILAYYQKPEIINENEMMYYSLMNDSDPNEQWHDNQMLITISNKKNEIVFSFLMDNND